MGPWPEVLRLVLFWSSCTLALGMHPIYDIIQKKMIPTPYPGKPLEVHVGFYVESLGNFRSTEMTFDMDLYMYMSWEDPTMAHNGTDYVLINDKEVLERMWLPDLYFANARTAYFHEVTVHNFNMFINPRGVIAYGTRVTLNVACTLNLIDYPLDSQQCFIKIISYAHVQHEMNATWFGDGPIRFNPEIGLPEYHIVGLEHTYCNGTFHYTITHNSSRIGNFSCLMGIIQLDRAIGYHLVQSYIPTGLIVAISWVSFWIDRRAVPARVSLSFTTLLTLSTQGNGIRYGLPPVSYAKAIDYFYGVCMLFIFGVLLEFALVNSYMRRANKYNYMAEKMQQTNGTAPSKTRINDCGNGEEFEDPYLNEYLTTNGSTDFDSDSSPQKPLNQMNRNAAHLIYKNALHMSAGQRKSFGVTQRESMKYSRKALAVDQISRFAFPAVFVFFNIIYWMYYLKDRPATGEDVKI